jgi:hypothetical protein
VLRERFDELFESRHSQLQFAHRRRRRDAVRVGDLIGRLGDELAPGFFRRVARQEILPGLSGFSRLAGGQLRASQLKLCFDLERRRNPVGRQDLFAGIRGEEILVRLNRLRKLVQLLMTASNPQFDFLSERQARLELQCLLIERQRLGVIGLLARGGAFFGLPFEEPVGEFEIDPGQLVFTAVREEPLGLGLVNRRGGHVIPLLREDRPAAEPRPRQPIAFGEFFLEFCEVVEGRIKLFQIDQRQPLEVQQVIDVGPSLFDHEGVDELDRAGEVPSLQSVMEFCRQLGKRRHGWPGSGGGLVPLGTPCHRCKTTNRQNQDAVANSHRSLLDRLGESQGRAEGQPGT